MRPKNKQGQESSQVRPHRHTEFPRVRVKTKDRE